MRYFTCLLLSILSFTPPLAMAQYEPPLNLEPFRWFPLELGNYWHYTDRGGEGVTIETQWVVTTDKDTLVEGKHWTRFRNIYCEGPQCAWEILWYRLTSDAYLLIDTGSFSRVDTLWNTRPKSIFAVNVRRDTLYRSLDGFPVFVEIWDNPIGSEADSSFLTLDVKAGILSDEFT